MSVARLLCIGHAVQDFVFSVTSIPAGPEKYRATAFQTMGGGPAATAAVTIARLGGGAQLAARLGDDRVADIVVAELEGYGVDCSLLRRIAGSSSSVSSVVVDEQGERQIVNFLDASMPSDADWLPGELPENIDAVLADTRWPEGGLHGLRLARQAGIPAVLDADVPVPADGALVAAATHVAFSASGLAGFCGDADPATALRSASSRTDAWCGVTLGGQGTMFVDGSRIRHTRAYEVKPRDTLGAGDVWHGAFALALAEGRATDHAVRFAGAAAALKVRDGAGRAGTPTRRDVEAMMSEQKPETVACQ